jgi:hypothetical protein
MQLRPLLVPVAFSLLAAPQIGLRPPRVGPVEDIQVLIEAGFTSLSARTGERIVQDVQVTVKRRNNRRPVGAGLLVRVRTPDSGPSATFGRGGSHETGYTTDENGEFHIQRLLANQIAGTYTLEITVDYTGPDRAHYIGSRSIEMKNFKAGVPGWVKYVAIAGAGGIAACLSGACRPHDSNQNPNPNPPGPNATISFGSARVVGR